MVYYVKCHRPRSPPPLYFIVCGFRDWQRVMKCFYPDLWSHEIPVLFLFSFSEKQREAERKKAEKEEGILFYLKLNGHNQ